MSRIRHRHRKRSSAGEKPEVGRKRGGAAITHMRGEGTKVALRPDRKSRRKRSFGGVIARADGGQTLAEVAQDIGSQPLGNQAQALAGKLADTKAMLQTLTNDPAIRQATGLGSVVDYIKDSADRFQLKHAKGGRIKRRAEGGITNGPIIGTLADYLRRFTGKDYETLAREALARTAPGHFDVSGPVNAQAETPMVNAERGNIVGSVADLFRPGVRNPIAPSTEPGDWGEQRIPRTVMANIAKRRGQAAATDAQTKSDTGAGTARHQADLDALGGTAMTPEESAAAMKAMDLYSQRSARAKIQDQLSAAAPATLQRSTEPSLTDDLVHDAKGFGSDLSDAWSAVKGAGARLRDAYTPPGVGDAITHAGQRLRDLVSRNLEFGDIFALPADEQARALASRLSDLGGMQRRLTNDPAVGDAVTLAAPGGLALYADKKLAEKYGVAPGEPLDLAEQRDRNAAPTPTPAPGSGGELGEILDRPAPAPSTGDEMQVRRGGVVKRKKGRS